MATRRYEINRGATEFTVTSSTGLATVNKNMELTYDQAVFTSKVELITAIENIRNQILKDNFQMP